MKKSRQKKSAKLKKHSSLLSRGSVAILLGVTLVLSLTVIFAGFVGSSKGVAASSNPQVDNKRYKATRALVIDRQTGQLRMPTSEEIDEALASLATLSKRPTDGLVQTAAANGSVAVDLDGGYGGVMLARPNDDGTWETKCVFSFDEGIEFLGFVEDKSQR